MTQWDATGGNNQKWKLENQSDGTIRLTNVNSGLVLDYNTKHKQLRAMGLAWRLKPKMADIQVASRKLLYQKYVQQPRNGRIIWQYE